MGIERLLVKLTEVKELDGRVLDDSSHWGLWENSESTGSNVVIRGGPKPREDIMAEYLRKAETRAFNGEIKDVLDILGLHDEARMALLRAGLDPDLTDLTDLNLRDFRESMLLGARKGKTASLLPSGDI